MYEENPLDLVEKTINILDYTYVLIRIETPTPWNYVSILIITYIYYEG